jgi:hypothetical protein
MDCRALILSVPPVALADALYYFLPFWSNEGEPSANCNQRKRVEKVPLRPKFGELQSTVVAAVFSFAFIAPALADTWKCDEANLNDMKAQVGKLDSKAAQEEGAKEWELAITAMKGNNMDECNLRMPM